ncbi:MAG: heavy metal translocating P-type ATPase [Propionibacteriaceae bacterium]|jgi:Cd2+/Zn2+-exporting ATPase|nr:heavy metal translocating P-type ATPase [Propionibacteriaceae bacterium]
MTFTEEAQRTATSDRSDHRSGQRAELVLALVSGAAYLVGLALEHLVGAARPWSGGAYLLAGLAGGWTTARQAWASIRRRHFEVDSLMLLAAVGAAAVGRWAEGAVLLFLFSLGHALEESALARASHSIQALGQLAPRTAWLKTGSDTVQERPVEQLRPGDVVLVRPHARVPADGLVVAGRAVVDQSAVTGESTPAEKGPWPEALAWVDDPTVLAEPVPGPPRTAGVGGADGVLGSDRVAGVGGAVGTDGVERVVGSDGVAGSDPSARSDRESAPAPGRWDAAPRSARVFAGSVNGPGAFELVVTATAQDSTLARVVALIEQAEAGQSPTQSTVKRIERIYVPAVLAGVALIALIGWAGWDQPFAVSFHRAMVVLVAASPCALAISTPAAVVSAIARAARAGALVKGGAALEALGRVQAMAFDKTGTLTWGQSQLTEVVAAAGVERQDLVQTVWAVEALSDHPLAQSVRRGLAGQIEPGQTPPVTDLEAVPGRGLRARSGSETVLVGSTRLLEESGRPLPAELALTARRLEAEGRTVMAVQRGAVCLGLIGLMDTPRQESVGTLQALRRGGVDQLVLLSGDNQSVAEAVGRAVGVDRALGELLPQDKVAAIRRLGAGGRVTCMVGDGVNDAPALAQADLGLAMGAAGSAVALEACDIALMSDDLGRVPFLRRLAQATSRVVRQNLALSLAVVAVLAPLALLDLSLTPVVLIHEGSTLLVVCNGLRLLRFEPGGDHADIEHQDRPV